MSRIALVLLGLMAGVAIARPTDVLGDEFSFQHEHVLGTSCAIQVWTQQRRHAQDIEKSVLAEVDRLQKVFSTYDPESELMRWQHGQLSGAELSQELLRCLERAEYWRVASEGAFDVRTAELTKLWRAAELTQVLPKDGQVNAVCGALKQAPYGIDQLGRVQRHDNFAISLDAIAKGYILDAACERAMREHAELFQQPSTGLSVMIGGDMRCVGKCEQVVAIANPLAASENDAPIESVKIRHSMGLATSGGYRRFHEIQGQRYSHIVDPRTGRAAAGLAGVTVIAPCGMDADAAATAVCVLGPVKGLQLIESLDGFAALLVLNSGERLSSSRWSLVQVPSSLKRPTYVNATVTPDDKDKTGLFVKFTLGSAAGGRYHRPYVAVWLEDKDGFPVKTSILWLQTSGPGPRWHRDLTKWYGNDQMRKLVDQKELIGTISGATRGPGEYETRFDGTDNDGKPLKPGRYALCLEAAREHGTHQFVREAIEWSGKPVAKKELKAGTEFSAISYRYVPTASVNPAK